MDYPGLDGFLGTRASLMLDVVFLAMFAVIPVMGISIALVRYRRLYTLHKRIQLALGAILLVAVAAFELDMRLHGWRERAIASPYYANIESPPAWLAKAFEALAGAQVPGWVFLTLYVHLVFAVTTAVLWVVVIVRALRRFPVPPVPGEHSRAHIFWARAAAIDMTLTAATGWTFYWLAFVAS